LTARKAKVGSRIPLQIAAVGYPAALKTFQTILMELGRQNALERLEKLPQGRFD
jgi:hypothetical protein